MLVMALMPAGFVLDSFVYPDKVQAGYFSSCGCIASALALLACFSLRWPGLSPSAPPLAAVPMGLGTCRPAFFISWMIGASDGSTSAYYAGLESAHPGRQFGHPMRPLQGKHHRGGGLILPC